MQCSAHESQMKQTKGRFASPPSRKETDATHERRVRDSLGFATFDDAVREDVERWIRDRAAEEYRIEERGIVD
jgi:hypothetical protein